MEREALKLLVLSMCATEKVADRALQIIDWIRGRVSSICPMGCEVLNALIDVKLKEDAEATCFALGAMGACLKRQDPDAALYLLLKSDDAREVLMQEGRHCPPGRPPGSRPAAMGTPSSAMMILNAKREKLAACLLYAASLKKKPQKQEQQPEAPRRGRRQANWLNKLYAASKEQQKKDPSSKPKFTRKKDK